MKTIRLLYPDYRSGGLDTYYFGAQLMAYILPANPNQPLLTVNLPPPDGEPRPIHDGIAAKEEVFAAPNNPTKSSPLAATASSRRPPSTTCTASTARVAKASASSG